MSKSKYTSSFRLTSFVDGVRLVFIAINSAWMFDADDCIISVPPADVSLPVSLETIWSNAKIVQVSAAERVLKILMRETNLCMMEVMCRGKKT